LRFDVALRDATAAIGLHIGEPQRLLMWSHFGRVVEASRRFNLTRITDPVDAAVKHYTDSLALLACPGYDADRPMTVLDVGTGAGYPAVPLAIVCESWRVTAIDGTGKKARFVSQAAAALGLDHLTARQVRAGDLIRQSTTRFDLILLRAVGRIDAGLRQVYQLVEPGGSIVFYKTPGMDGEELKQGFEFARSVGLVQKPHFDLMLTLQDETIPRRLVRYEGEV